MQLGFGRREVTIENNVEILAPTRRPILYRCLQPSQDEGVVVVAPGGLQFAASLRELHEVDCRGVFFGQR